MIERHHFGTKKTCIAKPKRAAWTDNEIENVLIFVFVFIPAVLIGSCIIVSAIAGTVWLVKQAF